MPPARSPYATLLLLALCLALAVGWWLPNRPQRGDVAGDGAVPITRLASVSFAPYRPGESPLAGRFPTRAEVDQDLALIATRAGNIRTYAAIEGDYDLPALARAHHLTMWQGIWLGPDRAANEREMEAGIAAANRYPDVIRRVVVGNEVLLRRDLPAEELIADIDRVKRAIHQPVTYADVWNFFVDHPQLVPHLDVATIHILPYWEDHPTNIPGVIAHAHDVLATMRARFPGVPLAIGETGWPSRGRWRQDAAPGRVNEAIYLRRFVAFAATERLDYNIFQSFDENWKYRDEGVVGPSWGLWTADRRPKFPLDSPVSENPDWPVPAALSVVCALLLFGLGGGGGSRQAIAAAALGGALGVAWVGCAHVLFDRWAVIAAIGNLSGQAALALLCMHRLGAPPRATRTGRDATLAAADLLAGRRPAGWTRDGWPAAVFDDLLFVFIWTAAVLQALLWYDGRYRDFPIPTFAVPVAVIVLRALFTGLPRSGGGREEAVVGGALAVCAIGSAVLEGWLNTQSLVWNFCALLLAGSVLLRLTGGRMGAGKPGDPRPG